MIDYAGVCFAGYLPVTPEFMEQLIPILDQPGGEELFNEALREEIDRIVVTKLVEIAETYDAQSGI